MLDVPGDDRFRLVLRLFEMNLDRAGFAIRFQPGFAEVVDLATPQAGLVRVEVAPLTRGSAFRAYVSVTSNESQQGTLVTPQ